MTGAITSTERFELNNLAIKIRQGLSRTAGEMVSLGEDLLRAKEILPPGTFGSWVQETVGISLRYAQQFMSIARAFGNRREMISHLPPGALLELGAPSTPESVINQVIGGSIEATPRAIREATQQTRKASTEEPTPLRQRLAWRITRDFLALAGDYASARNAGAWLAGAIWDSTEEGQELALANYLVKACEHAHRKIEKRVS